MRSCGAVIGLDEYFCSAVGKVIIAGQVGAWKGPG